MFNNPVNAIVSVAVALALLVVMPLALRLIEAPGLTVLTRWWLPLSIPALVALLRLTVPHMHFAGCVAALNAGLTARAVRNPVARAAALAVPVGTLVILAGYFTSDEVELLGALILTAGLWLTAWLTLRLTPTGAATMLTRASAATLAVTMTLAITWAAGEATGLPHPSLTWMAATHGLANAFGFALCAVLAWRRAAVSPL